MPNRARIQVPALALSDSLDLQVVGCVHAACLAYAITLCVVAIAW